MPWRPRGRPEYDPQLDPYRDRAARLRDDAGAGVATMYVEVQGYATATSGRLWWSRWTPYRESLLISYFFTDGRSTDTFAGPDDLAGILSEWADGHDDVFGHWYGIEWLSESATEQTRANLELDPSTSFDPDRRAGLGRRFAADPHLRERDRALRLLLDEDTFVTHETGLALLARRDDAGTELVVEAMCRADLSTAVWLVDAVHAHRNDHHGDDDRRLRNYLESVTAGSDAGRRAAARDLLGGLSEPPVFPDPGPAVQE